MPAGCCILIAAALASGAASPLPLVSEDSVGKAWGTTRGILQFRGNPTHTFYGTGPLPTQPKVLWRFPKHEAPMCAISPVGKQQKRWCGTGWTGQPVVWERPDGVTEVIFGAYDRKVHFLDADTGERTRPDFAAGDIIKGSVTLDPDGYPLIYFGARDNRLRIVALDRKRPTELWSLPTRQYPHLHSNDWDSNPSLVGGVLIAAGENGYLYAVRLNRSLDARGRVQVAPEILVAYRGWTDALIDEVGDEDQAIESSPVVFGQRVYFTNGQGRVAGLDLSNLHRGVAPLVFDYWTGDDTDASLVVDASGMLYVSVELERFLPRSRQVGQLIKLDPTREGDPRVWGLPVPAGIGDERGGGIWSTPALGKGVLYVTTQAGDLLVVDASTGEIAWRQALTRHLWSSPVLVDDTLLVATCDSRLLAYHVGDPRAPRLHWSLPVGKTRKCIESTPAVWKGRIYVGSWDGYFYAVGSAPPAGPLAER